jgi:hypothetical protein
MQISTLSSLLFTVSSIKCVCPLVEDLFTLEKQLKLNRAMAYAVA